MAIIAERDIRTSGNANRVDSAIISNLVTKLTTPKYADSICNAPGKMLKDDDCGTDGNPGVTKAREAALQTRAPG